MDPEALTTKTILRDADKTGELVRNEKRDSLGVLRELEIVYTNRTVGTRYYDATGKLVKIKRTAGSGGIEGVPDAGGKYTKQWKQFNGKGVVIRDFTRLSDDHHKIRVYRADGTLHWESEVQQGTGQVFRMYHPDGKTVHLETEVANLRTRLDIFETDGKLLYREKLKDPKTARFGDVVEYTGQVYDAAGKVRRRALSNEGPYSNWHATFTDVEELADDGTVTSSGRPVRFDDTDYRSKLKDAQLQRIIEAKAAAYKLKNRGGLDAEVQEQWIDEVLRD